MRRLICTFVVRIWLKQVFSSQIILVKSIQLSVPYGWLRFYHPTNYISITLNKCCQQDSLIKKHRNNAYGCCTYSLQTYRLTAFKVDRCLIFSNVRCQFLFQRAMPLRNFNYQLYVLFSVLCMRKTLIKQGK